MDMVKALGDKFVEFLSPVGELHFSIGRDYLICALVSPGFRPLSGNYISQYKRKLLKNSLTEIYNPMRENKLKKKIIKK